jgi:hypothetical protein
MTSYQRLLLIATFLVLLIGRLWMAGTGYLEDQDELLFQWIHMNFKEFNHFSTWIDAIFQMQGQPPEIFIRLIEYISVIPLSNLLEKQIMHPDVLYFIGIYNIMVSLLILFVFYKILLRLDFHLETAILGALFLGTLLNFNLYTRHIIPYDNAILFHLLSLYFLLVENQRKSTICWSGFFSVIGLTMYMGSFMFVFINGVFLLYRQFTKFHFKKVFISSLLFLIPFIAVVLTYEASCQYFGKSYLKFISDYSKTVYMASPDEGFSFIFKYFSQVERWWGTCFLTLFFCGLLRILIKMEFNKRTMIVLIGVLAYILYGTIVILSEKVVFYGRVLHVFYPFVTIGVLVFLQDQKAIDYRKVYIGLASLALINYFMLIQDLNQIGYPRNAFYKFQLFEVKDKIKFCYYNEMATPVIYSNRKEWLIDSIGSTNLSKGIYRAYNLCFNIHYPDSAIKVYPPTFRDEENMIYQQLHFQSHPAYAFEYCARDGRNLFINKALKIKILRIRD